MEALAQRTPPRNARALAELDVAFKLLAELTAIVTSSEPSPLIIDQPSSLNPLTASLKPLEDEKHNNSLTNRSTFKAMKTKKTSNCEDTLSVFD